MMPFKPIEQYEPKQRGMVASAKMARGNRFLKDGETTGEECPDCGVLLRVSRRKRGPILLTCPCGHEREVS